MTKRNPQLRDVMTRMPIEMEVSASLADAYASMVAHDIHHLPILDGTRLAGVITFVELQRALAKEGEAATSLPVGGLCHREPITMSPTSALDEVVEKMLGNHRDGVVVVDGGVVVGIFTVHDALRALLELLR